MPNVDNRIFQNYRIFHANIFRSHEFPLRGYDKNNLLRTIQLTRLTAPGYDTMHHRPVVAYSLEEYSGKTGRINRDFHAYA